MRSAKKITHAVIPAFFAMGKRMCETEVAAAPGNMIKPTIPATAIDESCPTAVGHAKVTIEARIAIVARSRSGQSERAIPHTAWATTATATTLRPCNQPASAVLANAPIPKANAISANADGRVKPIQAASPPRRRARAMPIAILTWLLAGPGKNWQSATRSA